jgi:hypothetical protein
MTGKEYFLEGEHEFKFNDTKKASLRFMFQDRFTRYGEYIFFVKAKTLEKAKEKIFKGIKPFREPVSRELFFSKYYFPCGTILMSDPAFSVPYNKIDSIFSHTWYGPDIFSIGWQE